MASRIDMEAGDNQILRISSIDYRTSGPQAVRQEKRIATSVLDKPNKTISSERTSSDPLELRLRLKPFFSLATERGRHQVLAMGYIHVSGDFVGPSASCSW